MFCHKCGTQIAEGAVFCHGCGTKVVYADTDHTKPEDDFEASNANTDKTALDAPAETGIPTNSPVEDVYAFRSFVDNHVRATTEYQSAEEMLNSEVNQTFLWICLAIPVVFFIRAALLDVFLFIFVSLTLGYMPVLRVTRKFPCIYLVFPVILFIRQTLMSYEPEDVIILTFAILLFGYPLALMVDLILSLIANKRIAKISGIGTVRISGSIDTDELIEFLNQSLGYMSPHFHEWGRIRYRGFGVRGTLRAAYFNAVSPTIIGTKFGRKKRCFAEINVKPYEETTGSIQTKYYFSTAMSSLWPSKYICVVKTVPILQAIMDYYIKYYRTGGENDYVLS